MVIEAIAPNRIDLAGGTLDIYPLFLFEDDPITVNMAITLLSRVRITPRDDERIEIRSVDGGVSESAPNIDELQLGGRLDLIARLIRFYRPSCGITVETENQAPRGSGVGGSSALLIATSGALNELNENRLDRETLIRYGADLEAQNIGIPTGKQDYYPAFEGGVLGIKWGVRTHHAEQLIQDEDLLRELEDRLVLCFTREHSSSVTNWSMLSSYIGSAPGSQTRRAMARIKATAHEMARVLKTGDLDGFAAALREEWANRRQLAPDVSDDQIDTLIESALTAGAQACKLCGAGGGGCMVSFVAPGTREAVEQALVRGGARLLPFKIARRGMTVTRSG